MPKTYELTMAGETLVLRADRSLWWPARSILFIADLHAGKARHFQQAGQAIPDGSLAADLGRLQQAIDELRPKRVIVLGDLFHSDINSEWEVVTDWIRRQPCSIELVRGNHDRFIDDATFEQGGLRVHEEDLQIGSFTLRHHPLKNPSAGSFILCGHLHPVHMFRGVGSDKFRLPSFIVKERQLILPAYGSFTGGLNMSASAGLIAGTAPDFSTLILKR